MQSKPTLLIVNPHIDGSKFYKAPSNLFSGRRNYLVYEYWLPHLYENFEVRFFFSKKATSFPFYFPRLLEIALFYFYNRLNPMKWRFHSSFSSRKTDFCFLFGHMNLDTARGKKLVDELNIRSRKVVVHLTHIHCDTALLAQNIQNIENKTLVAESSLSSFSKYYEKYFGNLPVYSVVNPPSTRFRDYIPFEDRVNKCAISGSVFRFPKRSRFAEFRNYFLTDYLQPNRKMFLDMKEELGDIASVRCSQSEFTLHTSKKNYPMVFRKLLSAYRFFFTRPQSSYFGFNIVEFYNSHKFFSVPSEVTGLPSIGIFEGMACGAVLVTESKEALESIGMKDGRHFLSYDGSLEDFRRTIRGSTDENQLAKIRENSLAFIRKYSCEKELKKQIMDVFLR